MKSFRLFFETYQEETGSTFYNEGETYDINKIFRETENIPAETMKVSELDWIINDGDLSHDDVERVDAIDNLTTPILITKKDGKLLVVDGYHRLLKAKSEGWPNILVKWVPHAVMLKAVM